MGGQENEAWILLSLGLWVIGLRIWVRWEMVGIRNFAFDDYLVCISGVGFPLARSLTDDDYQAAPLVFVAETVAAYLVGAMFDGLTNSYMTDEQRARLDPNSNEFYKRVWGSKIQVIGWSFYAFILWSLKLCLATSYKRLFERTSIKRSRLLISIAFYVIGATYIIVALSILLSCQPLPKFWQIYPNPGNLCQPTLSSVYVLVVIVFNVLTDAYLLSIPLPLLWQVNIGLRKRLPLMALFSGGLFIGIAGCIRAHVILNSGPEGAAEGSRWACRETFVAIVVTNMPFIHPKIRAVLQAFKWTKDWVTGSSRSRSGRSGNKSGTGGGGAGATASCSKSQSRRGAFQLQDLTPKNGGHGHFKSGSRAKVSEKSLGSSTAAWDSDEHILRHDDSVASSVRPAQPEEVAAKGSGIAVLKEITVHESSANDDVRLWGPDWGYNKEIGKGKGSRK
ncbi:integral membrane protein PTH11 [Apiospora phragmitis]|uniref:Integral membrane protein PTH11 n=1 Tax=Apiospora phragmitis TaxID=2905665 RepID=A0ABR1VJ38_9PEZI